MGAPADENLTEVKMPEVAAVPAEQPKDAEAKAEAKVEVKE